MHWWQEQRARLLVKRDVAPRAAAAGHKTDAFAVRDPGFAKQWHLHDSAMSINVQPVWDSGHFGKGVLVTIVDDGLQFIHPDLAANWRADASYDFNDDDPDVTPDPRIDDHGTSAAGACCGVNVSASARRAPRALERAARARVTSAFASAEHGDCTLVARELLRRRRCAASASDDSHCVSSASAAEFQKPKPQTTCRFLRFA